MILVTTITEVRNVHCFCDSGTFPTLISFKLKYSILNRIFLGEQGLPTDPTGLQQLAADQGFDLNQYGAMLGDIDKQGLASAAGQVAGQMAGGGKNQGA